MQAAQREGCGGPTLLPERQAPLIALLAIGLGRLANTSLPDVDSALDLSAYPGVNSTETVTQW